MKNRNDMIISHRKLITIIICAITYSILSGCNHEPKLLMQRVPYEGNELRINGYYYYQTNNFGGYQTRVIFLFRNGVMFNPFLYGTHDLNEVEKELILSHEKGWFNKQWEGWGVFNINGDRIECEKWSVEGGHVLRYVGRIENDSTIHLLQFVDPLRGISSMDEICHFQKFLHKPDSVKSFIK